MQELVEAVEQLSTVQEGSVKKIVDIIQGKYLIAINRCLNMITLGMSEEPLTLFGEDAEKKWKIANEKEKNSSGWPFLEGGYKKGEESFQCRVEFAQYYGISIYNAENNERVLSGLCKFGKEELVVEVRLGKKYKEKEKITFIRYPLETESETEENAKTE